MKLVTHIHYFFSHFYLLVFTTAMALSGNGQIPTITYPDAAEDLSVFQQALHELHPGIGLHISEQELDSLITQLVISKEGIATRTFYKKLLYIVSSLKDGHSDLYAGSNYAATYRNKLMPFQFNIVDNELYLEGIILGGMTAPPNYLVKRINGRTSTSIIQELNAHTPADGGNLPFKNSYNSKIFSRRYAQLIEVTDSFAIEIYHSDKDSIVTSTFRGIPDSALYVENTSEELLKFRIQDSIAYLKISSFHHDQLLRAGYDYYEFLEHSFTSLRETGTSQLVLDIRSNIGGHNLLALSLYAYLSNGKFQGMGTSLAKAAPTEGSLKYARFPRNDPSWFGMGCNIENHSPGWLAISQCSDSQNEYTGKHLVRAYGMSKQSIKNLKYSGTVICLTDPLTFSAASIFASLLKRDNRAIFVGQETGGSSSWFCGSGHVTVTLPNTKFELNIPRLRRCVAGMETAPQGKGVLPNYPVITSLEELRLGQDAPLKKAISLLR